MTKGEEQTIRNVLAKLKAPRFGASKGYCEGVDDRKSRIYIDTWLIPGLEYLLPESRDVDLACRMSR